MVRVLELFAGIGACSKALTNLGIGHEIVDAVEIDKYAIQSFNAIHGTNFEPQDITKWDKDIECDLIMHGSPCQDFSAAGKQAGGDKGSGTRSSLMYETLRIVEKLKPKYVIWENVKNLLSKKHRHNFDAYIETMNQLGYVSRYQVMNAKDYGVPQNRERVFTVSIRDDHKQTVYGRLEDLAFTFPKQMPLEKKLKDVLEENVDEKYYISENMMNYFMGVNQKPSKFPRRERFLSNINRKDQDRANSITTAPGQRPTDNFVKEPTPLQREVCNRAIESGLVRPNDAIEYTYSAARLDEISQGYIKKQNNKDNTVMSTLKCNPQQIGVCVDGAEPVIAASRGRNPDAPSDRTTGAPTVQRLEFNTKGTTNTITSVQKDNYVCEPTEGVPIRTANKKGYDMAYDGDGIDLGYPQSNTRRGRVGHGVSKTLPTSDSQGTLSNFRIRKLTPLECWRLMGFDDSDFMKAKAAGTSNTQLYKQAGNSIVVNCLEAIFKNLLEKER